MHRSQALYGVVSCLLLCLCLLLPRLVWAQRYEERLRFLHEKLEELEQIERSAIQAQITLAASHNTDEKRQRDQWKALERRSRETITRVEVIIKQLEGYFFQNVIDKYIGEDKGDVEVDTSIVLTRLDGRRERIRSYLGQVILLHFWATWCKPCLHEVPSLNSFYDRFASDHFEVLAISLDARRKDVHRFLAGRGVRFPVYMDAGRSVYHKVVGGLEVLPRSILIDKKGNVFKSYVGEQQWESPLILEDVGGLLSAQ